MTKLKLGSFTDEKPIKLSIEPAAPIYRDLLAYAEALARETGQAALDPPKLIGPMVARFMATDRGFAQVRRSKPAGAAQTSPGAG